MPPVETLPLQPVPNLPLSPSTVNEKDSTASIAIEQKLDANQKQLSPDVLNQIYGDLNNLRSHETDNQFQDNLVNINAKLHHDGYLPNLYIVSNTGNETVDPTKAIGPKGDGGFHFADTQSPPTVPLAKPGEAVDQTAPSPAPMSPGEATQGDYNTSNPVSPGGSNGYNSEGETPIGNSDVESSPIASGTLDNRMLVSQIQEALRLINAQRAAQGLPPISDDANTEDAILTIIKYESGGNPNATNGTDSNAAKGDPSRGLMQTIGSTFSSNHVQGTSNNIFDPVANIAAGINYATNRYGSVENVPGVLKVRNGQGYVGY